MTNFFSYALKKKFPSLAAVRSELQRLTLLSVLFYTVLVTVLVLFYILLANISRSQTVLVPKQGGTLREGVIGAPRFINPLLAASATDTHLVSMIYSGLTKRDTSGTIESDLATYTISPDKLIYTFTLKENTKFSTGAPLTSADVLYTYDIIKNGYGGRDLQNSWHAINVSTTDPKTVIFTLPIPDENFLLLTTIGIFPKALWETTTLETFADAAANIEPVGSGPFKLIHTSTQNGIPHTLLLRKNHFSLSKPFLKTYKIIVYPNQDAIARAVLANDIDLTTALAAENIADYFFSGFTITDIPTNDTLVIAALPTNNFFSDGRLRTFYNTVIDKGALLATIDGGYGLLQDQIDSLSGFSPLEQAKQVLLSHKEYSVSQTGTLLKQGTPIHLLLVVESNSKEALAANFITAKLLDAGISAEVRSFDSGTFRDLVAHGAAPAIVTTKDRSADAYTIELPLYTRTAPIIINKKMSSFLSQSGTPTFSNLYTTTATWFTNTERQYKWFEKE